MSENAPATPPAQPTGASSPPSGGDGSTAGGPTRMAAVILAFVLAFIAAVAVVTMLDVGELTPCEDVTSPTQLVDNECFDGSASAKTRTQIFGWIGAGLAAISILAALRLGMTGRGRRPFALLVAATFVMLLLSLVL